MRNNDGDKAHTRHGKIAEKNTRLVVSNEAGVFNCLIRLIVVKPTIRRRSGRFDGDLVYPT